MAECVFCEILAGRAPVSMIYEDDEVAAFMSLYPSRPGECLVIPKEHIDCFTDVDDDTAAHIMVIAQRIGRRMREVFQPQRVGMVVHGFGVPHAHLILVPQHSPTDITSARFASIEDGCIVFSVRNIEVPQRSVLDEHARLLKID